MITGLHGSGKTTAASILSKRGWRVIATGDVIREETRRRGLDENWENLSRVSLEFFESRQHTIIPTLENRIKDGVQASGLVIVEGVKTPLEFQQLSTLTRYCFTIAVLCSPTTRMDRLRGRRRPDAAPDPVNLYQRDNREIVNGLGELMVRSDYYVVNEGSLASLDKQVTKVADDAQRRSR